MNTFYEYFANRTTFKTWYDLAIAVCICVCVVFFGVFCLFFERKIDPFKESKRNENLKEKTHIFNLFCFCFIRCRTLTARQFNNNTSIASMEEKKKKRKKNKKQLAYCERKKNCVVIVIMAISLAVFVSDRHLYKNWIQLVTGLGNFSPSNTNQFHVNWIYCVFGVYSLLAVCLFFTHLVWMLLLLCVFFFINMRFLNWQCRKKCREQ